LSSGEGELSYNRNNGVCVIQKNKVALRKELEAEFGSAVAAHAVALQRQRIATDQGLDTAACDAALAAAVERRRRARNALMEHVLRIPVKGNSRLR
jgi:hypothetical protein